MNKNTQIIEEIIKEYNNGLDVLDKVGQWNPINISEYSKGFIKQLLKGYTPNSEVRKMQEEAEYKVLMDFKGFVANGATTDRFFEDFEAEFELFMARNYAELRVKDLSE